MAKRARRAAVGRARSPMVFDALRIEGGLFSSDMLTEIASGGAAEQSAEDYGLPANGKLRDVIQSQFQVAQSLWMRFDKSERDTRAVNRFVIGLITQVFEFDDLAEVPPPDLDGRLFPIGRAALAGRAPVVIAPSGDIDRPSPAFGDAGRQRAPAQLLQEYLNAEECALWGLVCDGVSLRLYRDNAALTRPAFIEVDLARLFDIEESRLGEFSALWLLIHASRFGRVGTPATDCPLERWREAQRAAGAAARERLREGVEAALLELGRGLVEHADNQALRDALSDGRLTPQAYLEALLRLVYRLIFVFVAEAREVLHTPPPDDSDEFRLHSAARGTYARGYGLNRLRDRAVRRVARDENTDAWSGISIVFRALARGEPTLALPALGGLFAEGSVREFGDCQLTNRRFYEAIYRLAWISTEAGLERVNWRDMETEELGSVYESLLDLTPSFGGEGVFDFVSAAGAARKTTASYYTPDSLVQALLNETLDPLIEDTVRGKAPDQAVVALLDLKIIDPACGSGHFLLAAARRLATRIVQLKSPGAPSPAEFRHWLREAARRCLFGVDRNPMAVELAKVALWIETVEPGKPLSFLDAHIRCGDSLLGIYDLAALQKGIPDEAFAPLTGDDKEAAKAWKARNKAERDGRAQGELGLFTPPPGLLDAAHALDAQDEDDLASVEAKADAFRTLLSGPDRWRMEAACDLYVAAFLMPKTAAPGRHAGETTTFIPTSRDVWDKLVGRKPYSLVEAPGIDAAREARAFHWPLEFPQVFFPGAGRKPGFDLAVGNPPWEVSQLKEDEYFASRAPEISELAGQDRKDAILALELAAPPLWSKYLEDKRLYEAGAEFARSCERFSQTATGKLNSYALFSELFSTIADRAGAIVPRNIATDSGTSDFFSTLVTSGRLRALLCFENEAFIFPSVHHAFQFALMALERPLARSARYIQFIRSPAQLSDHRRAYSLSASDIDSLNPNTRTAPVFRSEADATLTKMIHQRVPVLIRDSDSTSGNPWALSFRQGLFNMTTDSGSFRTSVQLSTARCVRDGRDWIDEQGQRLVPLLEAKMIDFYDHRSGGYDSRNDGRGFRVLPETSQADHDDPAYDPQPYYWVPEKDVDHRLGGRTARWMWGFKDITAATNERTVICAAFPRSGAGNTLALAFSGRQSREVCALLASLASLPLDYVARQKVGGLHLTFTYVKQFPVLPPQAFSVTDLDFIVERVLELSYTSHSMRPFAEDLAYFGPPFGWNEDRRALLRAELDARIAHLYGLTRDQLRYILDPEDVMGKGYPSETFRVLKNNEMREYGEYRTARLVLDAWDREHAT
jgi:hypothetical protein